MTDKNITTLTIKLSRALKGRIKAAAALRSIHLGDYVTKILKEKVEKDEKERHV